MQEIVVTPSRPQPSHGHAVGPRPSRDQIEPAALSLLARHSAGLLATARRYSACPEDAEDAYQRGVEILLTKAPTTREDELLSWLKTVVKHEAYAVRKSNNRALPAEQPAGGEPDPDGWTDERAERYEKLRLGAEALANLKPQEVRCLLLRAEGLSYKEICAATGWTYTKVNRCITEGRRAFLKRVASIRSGAECARLAPAISRFVDGEASADELRVLRPHLKSCLACRATLREYRATPGRLAGLVPPIVALAPGAGGAGVGLRLLQALHDRFAALLDGPAASKAAAIAASAAVLAGGGTAGMTAIADHPVRIDPGAFRQTAAASAPGSPEDSPQFAAARAQTTATSAPAPASTVEPAPERAPDPAPEFDPGTAGGSARSTSPTPSRAPSTPTSAPRSKPAAAPPAEFMP